jgi:hypothetical protein
MPKQVVKNTKAYIAVTWEHINHILSPSNDGYDSERVSLKGKDGAVLFGYWS